MKKKYGYDMNKFLEQTVTLTFNPATWFLFATHHLIIIIICAKLFSNLTMDNKVMSQTLTEFTGLCITVTLTFDLATWFLFATYRPVMMITCAKLLSNPTMHNKVMGWT